MEVVIRNGRLLFSSIVSRSEIANDMIAGGSLEIYLVSAHLRACLRTTTTILRDVKYSVGGEYRSREEASRGM